MTAAASASNVAAVTDEAMEPELPRNMSSAMPDLASQNVPRLRAKVHHRLDVKACAAIPLDSLAFRPIRQEDNDEMIALHNEWFPVSYDKDFYVKACSGDIFALAAVHSSQSARPSAQASVVRPPRLPPLDASHCSVGLAEDEDIVGIITMSTNCELHESDMMTVLGIECAQVCQGHSDDGAPPSAGDGSRDARVSVNGCLAYILTLGVIDGYRRRGLARELIKRLVPHVERHYPHVHAVYLHVVTYNTAAIQLYEAMDFLRVGHYQNFYRLHGQDYDSYVYALYLNGAKPPWKWRLKNLFGFTVGEQPPTWRNWLQSTWSILKRSCTTNGEAVSMERAGITDENSLP